jgi:hypothetical protein
VKKRQLLKENELAIEHNVEFRLVRQGANHEIWVLGTLQFPIGRHAEIPERTALGTIRAARAHLEAQ